MTEAKRAAFSAYLNGDFDEFGLIAALDKIQTKSVKNDGAVYTPPEIVKFMVETCNPQPWMRIVEPSCGHGAFVVALLDSMAERHFRNPSRLFDWLLEKTAAVDLSETAVFETREILSAYFERRFGLTISPDSFSNVVHADGLSHPAERFDLCIGNPPYVRTKNLESEYLKKIRSEFETCASGNIDLYYAFVERYSKLSKETCLIVPNGLLSNASAKKLRSIIRDRLDLLIDFKHELAFKEARTYSCIFKIGDGSNDGRFLYAENLNERPQIVEAAAVFKEHRHSNRKEIDVLSGIATLCDSVYLTKRRGDRYFASANGVEFEIEKAAVVPYLKLTKIRNGDVSGIDYMIYPYVGKNLIEREEFEKNMPKAWAYLNFVKDRLALRDKGKTDGYESWYAYGRKQGLHAVSTKTVVAVPQMIGGECLPQKIEIGSLIEEFGAIAFTSGYLIPCDDKNSKACDFVLSDEFQSYAEAEGKPFPGKNKPYYSLTAKQVRLIADKLAN